MPLQNYAELQEAIAGWLARSDLTERIPDFIALAEANIRRRVRRKTVRESLTVASDVVQLAGVVAELRYIRLVTGSPWMDRPLSIVTPEILAERRAARGNALGRPRWASVVGRELLVTPAPDQPYTAEIIYFKQLEPLSAGNPANDELLEAPDLYLFGALKEAEAYLEHDERIPVWTAKFEAALEELNLMREREEYAASLKPVRLPVVFG